MQKTILVTGSTDGIGLETASMLVAKGHHVLLHGRNASKLEVAQAKLTEQQGEGRVETYVADLSRLSDVEALAKAVAEHHAKLDVLINNAGVFRVTDPLTEGGLDVRFVVNTIAPYILTRRLSPLLGATGRVVNVSSAAQAPVNQDALAGRIRVDDMEAYAQSKLAITMWSNALARSRTDGPIMIAVNPGSYLASKMVREGFGVAGNDLGIGADILTRAALSEEFADANGKYFDNDQQRFASPAPDALDSRKCEDIVRAIEAVLAETA